MDAPAKEVITAYMASFAGERAPGSSFSTSHERLGTGEIRYTRLEYLNPDGTPYAMTRSGDSLIMRLHFHSKVTIRDPSFGFQLYSNMGTLITEVGHWLHGMHIPKVEAGDGYIDVEIDSLNLVPGSYGVSLWITGAGGKPVYDGDVRAELEVEAADVYRSGRMLSSRYGLVYFPQRWKYTKPSAHEPQAVTDTADRT
jgi:lipopolysaccharide transport system ATP-binding protein